MHVLYESFAAFIALKRLFTSMTSSVHMELRRSRKRPVAFTAFERPFASVNSFVHLQHASLVESLVAVAAFERAFASVDENVRLESASVFECLLAEITLEQRSATATVNRKSGRIKEFVVAKIANASTLLRVHSFHVRAQRLAHAERFSAFATTERLHIAVPFEVTSEIFWHFKGRIAGRALEWLRAAVPRPAKM